MQAPDVTPPPSDAKLRVRFSEYELAVLTAHILSVQLQTPQQQLALNNLFRDLELDQYTVSRNVSALSKTPIARELTDENIMIILHAIKQPMVGAVARAIGVGSGFFQRATLQE